MTQILVPKGTRPEKTATGLKLITIQEFQRDHLRMKSRTTFLTYERKMLKVNPLFPKRIERSRNVVLYVERDVLIFKRSLAEAPHAEAPPGVEDGCFDWFAGLKDAIIAQPTACVLALPLEKRAEKAAA